MFNTFTPNEEIKKIPFYEDAKAKNGWEGQRTTKSIDKLISEISENLSLVGCFFNGYQKGTYGERLGFQVHFSMKGNEGMMIPARLDIACLPTRGKSPRVLRATQEMALYMTAQAIKGSYFLTVLSPSYIPFMSLMLTSKSTTLGQAWMENGRLSALLPPPDQEFEVVKGEVV